MRADELVVEVRSLDLKRKGVIPAKLLNLSGAVRWCNVGAWSLTLPAGHPLADALRLPGAGVIVTGLDGVLWSGPAEAPDVEYSSSVPAGLVTVTGVTDDVVLGDTLAWPSPASTSLTAQAGVNWPANTARSDGYWVGTGPVESLMHALVAANIGPSAPAARRGGLAQKLVMGTNLGRGPTVTKRVRFQNLGQALAELAAGSGVGFRVVQDGPTLKFETFATADRSGFVRFTVQNDRLTSQNVAIAAPGVTRPLVAGQGKGAARTLVAPTTPESVAAETAWGRRIERFIDQRQTNDTAELTQAGMEALAETGFTRVAVTSVTGDDQSMRWGRDFGLGDTVAVEVEGTETTSFITGLALVAGPDGVRTGADLGDTSNVDETRAVASRLSSLEGRASSLERTAEYAGGPVRQSFTPSLSGLTLGSGGTIAGRWSRAGTRAWFSIRITLGTGFEFTGAVSAGLPVQAASGWTQLAKIEHLIAGGTHLAMGRITSGSSVVLVYGVHPAYSGGRQFSVSATVPASTWAAGSTIIIDDSYEVAA